jgi:methyl-accepting chemotaxis protein
MLKNMTIKKKMMIFILGLTVAIYSITLGYTIYSLRKDAIKEAKNLADTYASDKANDIKAKLDEDMAITRAMALIMQDYVSFPTEQRKDLQFRLMRNVLAKYPKYEAIWMSWQLQYIDSEWYKEYGRLSINCYWDNGEIKTSEEMKDVDGFVTDGLYYRLLTDKEEVLTEPYEFDSYDLNNDQMLLAVSPTKTLINQSGEAIGVLGIDMSLEEYNKMTNIEGYDQGYAFLASNNGTIVAHKNPDFTNQSLDTLKYSGKLDFDLNETVQSGGRESFSVYSDEFSGEVYVSIAPIVVGRSDAPWSVGIVVPYSEITASINFTFRLMVGVGVLGLLFLTFVIWKISGDIVDSLETTNHILKDISMGDIDLDKKLEVSSENRLGQMSNSVNTLMDELNKKAEFSKQIGEGNLEADFEVASEQDILGNSLIGMRDNLQKAKTAESHRRWATEGLAQFAETLQSDAEDMDEFCGEIIANLVKYMGVVQGGIFLINDDDEQDKFIELRGAYAYERQKFLIKRLEITEGLIGQSILEQKHIYLKEIPNNYVNVTSGLGKANPSTILIVPLMLNQEVFGAIELVSFGEFAQHEIEFVEKLSENIASTISSVKTNYKTKNLLEQSKIQAEELQAQEEEMRQNMEELQATQEEMTRKEQEYLDRIAVLEKTSKS